MTATFVPPLAPTARPWPAATHSARRLPCAAARVSAHCSSWHSVPSCPSCSCCWLQPSSAPSSGARHHSLALHLLQRTRHQVDEQSQVQRRRRPRHRRRRGTEANAPNPLPHHRTHLDRRRRPRHAGILHRMLPTSTPHCRRPGACLLVPTWSLSIFDMPNAVYKHVCAHVVL